MRQENCSKPLKNDGFLAIYPYNLAPLHKYIFEVAYLFLKRRKVQLFLLILSVVMILSLNLRHSILQRSREF